MSKKISVIIPVYNVCKYIEQCLDSVVNQTYKNLEIIVIDDGSTDTSGEICDRYATIDNRVIAIHQKNGGAGAAKNAGLKIATGEYLAFVDSDDFLEIKAFENMIKIMNEEEADIVHCAFKNIYRSKEEVVDFINKKVTFNSEEYLKLFLKDWTCALLWNKLYKKSLFDNILFKENRIVDDEFFTYQGVLKAKKIVYKPIITYNYRQRKSGVMLSDSNKNRIINDRIDFLVERKNVVLQKYPKLKFQYIYHMYEYFSILLSDYACNIATRKKIRAILMKNICFNHDYRVFILFFNLVKCTYKQNHIDNKHLIDTSIYFE